MDLVAACRVFVHVGERGSFTLGAAAARVPQSVASRRIAALEEHFGERLFDRSARRAALTAFGRDMLPSAKRLVGLAEALEYNAEQCKLRPLSLAMPGTCAVRSLATLDAAARDVGIVLDFRSADPAERIELLRSHEVRVALVAVPAADADWKVPLGVAAAPPDVPPAPLNVAPAPPDVPPAPLNVAPAPPDVPPAPRDAAPAPPDVPPAPRDAASAPLNAPTWLGAAPPPGPTAPQPGPTAAPPDHATEPLYLETLRPGRTDRSFRRIWIQPEDDVPHIRDQLQQLGHRAALMPAQITVAASLIAAASETMRGADFLLCSASQAAELGMRWRGLAGAPVARGYRVAAVTGDDAERLSADLWVQLARALGAPVDVEGRE